MAAGSVALADAHRLAQQRLSIELAVWLQRTFPLLDLTNIDRTTSRWINPTTRLVVLQHDRSARLAADYLVVARQLDVGIDPEWLPELAAAEIEAITTSLRVTGPIKARELAIDGQTLAAVKRGTFQASTRAATRHALAGGRNTITNTLANDHKSRGWSRVTSGKPCAFCAMLASRGPVYSKKSVRFRAHDGCSCNAMAVFDRSDGWTDQARRYRTLWNDVAKAAPDPLNAFRRAIEA